MPKYNPERDKAWRTAHPANRLRRTAQSRARKLGIKFNLRVEDIVIPKRCPILGMVLDTTGGRKPNAVSLDRIDPRKGYVRGNVWIISWRANWLKADGSLAELKAIVAALEGRTQCR